MLALIDKSQNKIVKTCPDGAPRLDLGSDEWLSPAVSEWEDDRFRLATVVELDVPPGKQRVGAPAYSLIDGVPTEITEVEDIPVVVPQEVSRRQFKLQLEISGLTEAVEAWVGQQDRLVQIAYAESGSFKRGEPMLEAGLTGLGFTPEQIDAFFIQASLI